MLSICAFETVVPKSPKSMHPDQRSGLELNGRLAKQRANYIDILKLSPIIGASKSYLFYNPTYSHIARDRFNYV